MKCLKLIKIHIIGEDFNEDFMKGNDNPRKQNMMKFTSEHNIKTKYLGSTFIHPNGSDSSAIDFFLYQLKDQDKIIEIKKTRCNWKRV